MANASVEGSSRRPKRSNRRTKVSTRETGTRSSSSSTSERSDIYALDVEEHRRAREDFHNRAEKDSRDSPKRMESRRTVRRRSKTEPAHTSTSLDPPTRHQSSKHHSRRKRKEEKDDDTVIYVYKTSVANHAKESTTSLRSPRRPLERRSTSSFIPDRLRVLRTLGLEPSDRSGEHKMTARTIRPGGGRRHTYHGGEETTKRKTVRGLDPDAATVVSSHRSRETR